MNADQAWQATLGQLQMEMSKAAYNTWVRDTELVAFDEGQFTVGVQNAYARDWLESRLSTTFSRMLSGMIDRPAQVNFVVSQTTAVRQPDEEEELRCAQPGNGKPACPAINSRYTFENFVVGASNRLAHAACMAVAENPAHAYNPLFLYGGVGLGKTHLLHAIGNVSLQQGLEVLYITSEEFCNDLINAIRTHTTPAFREKYRQIDVLLIDDIQFIAGKESTQEEFFHTFNALHGQNKQIIITSDRPPKAMTTLEDRLRSRFEGGLIADLQPADLETRIAILRSKAERGGKQVSADVLETIARLVQSNIRELEGALIRVLAYVELSGAPMSQQLIATALADLLPQHSQVDARQVLAAVSQVFGIEVEALLGRDRTREVALPRQIAMFLMREEANLSLPQIGEVLGGRDHTTVMYACEKMRDMIERDDRMRRQIFQVRERLLGRV